MIGQIARRDLAADDDEGQSDDDRYAEEAYVYCTNQQGGFFVHVLADTI